MLLPELRVAAEYIYQQVARIKSPCAKMFCFNTASANGIRYGRLMFCSGGRGLQEEEAEPVTDAEEVVYAETDGSMVLTREGYKEAKVGRVFRAGDCREKPDKEGRGSISKSDYVAQITD